MIRCKSCGAEISKKLVYCSSCGKNARQEPPAHVPGPVASEPAAQQAPAEGQTASPLVAGPTDASPSHRVTITLPDHTQVDVEAGGQLILGRESPDPQVARAFAGFEDVSRRHVRFVNDLRDGSMLVMLGETGGQFGTFLDGQRLPNDKDSRVRLSDGARIRLGVQPAWIMVRVHDS